MDLTGKWRYIENYGYGVAEGELYLKQKGQMLAGRIVFTDKVEGESSYMIQEFLKGELEGRKCGWKPSSSTSFIRSFRLPISWIIGSGYWSMIIRLKE